MRTQRNPDTKGKTMTDTITRDEIASQVTYRNDERGAGRREWLYVVAAFADMLFGVAFTNDQSNPRPEWVTVPRDTTRADDAPGMSGIRHPLTVVPWWPEMLADFFRGATSNQDQDAPRVTGDQDTEQAYARGVADGRQEEQTRHAAWLDALVSDAHSFADDNSLCSEFDRFMEEHGLPTRVREHEIAYTVTATVTYSGTATVEGSSWEDAHETFHANESAYVDQDDARRYGTVTDWEVECD